MTVAFTTSVEGFTAASLGGGFFEGWRSPPSPQEHLNLMQNSTHLVIAADGDNVVGFATAMSDGILSAHIPLLEVLPAYRGRGAGAELIHRLLAQVGPLYMIDVMCESRPTVVVDLEVNDLNGIVVGEHGRFRSC